MITVMVLLSIFVISWGPVESASMSPTIEVGQYCIVNKLAYTNKEPQRGEVIAFYTTQAGEKKYLIKRIIGMPGEHIEFIDGYVFVDGNRLDEIYIDDTLESNCLQTFDVPKDCVFVLGDNRGGSYDSRFWEEPYLKISDIEGQIMFVL